YRDCGTRKNLSHLDQSSLGRSLIWFNFRLDQIQIAEAITLLNTVATVDNPILNLGENIGPPVVIKYSALLMLILDLSIPLPLGGSGGLVGGIAVGPVWIIVVGGLGSLGAVVVGPVCVICGAVGGLELAGLLGVGAEVTIGPLRRQGPALIVIGA
ncbi:hypothetical protein GQ44DRAFT_819878, partial [Phaeosphaeriaceae sp. PMI808]